MLLLFVVGRPLPEQWDYSPSYMYQLQRLGKNMWGICSRVQTICVETCLHLQCTWDVLVGGTGKHSYPWPCGSCHERWWYLGQLMRSRRMATKLSCWDNSTKCSASTLMPIAHKVYYMLVFNDLILCDESVQRGISKIPGHETADTRRAS